MKQSTHHFLIESTIPFTSQPFTKTSHLNRSLKHQSVIQLQPTVTKRYGAPPKRQIPRGAAPNKKKAIPRTPLPTLPSSLPKVYTSTFPLEFRQYFTYTPIPEIFSLMPFQVMKNHKISLIIYK